MTESQYKRANKTVYSVVSIILLYFVVVSIHSISDSVVLWQGYLKSAMSIISCIGVSICYVLWRSQKKGCIAMMVCATAAYAVIVIFGADTSVYAYAYPVLFCTMVYYNRRLVMIGNAEIIAINVIKLLIATEEQAAGAQIAVITTVLTAFASIKICKLLTVFKDESVGAVEEAAAVQETNQKKMIQIAGSIIENFDGAMDQLNNLQSNVDTSNLAMTNIAESTDSTAQSVQRQADMCVEIRNKTDAVEESMQNLIEASGRANSMVSQGAEVVENLKKQAQNVEEASSATVAVSNRLSEKVEDVQNFIGVILSISSQTNLLALNASIEAARAGEAGRGFAVVAEEIRQLSEQTKDASNSITSIINELILDTKSVNESVESAVQSIEKQNELIEETMEKFASVDEEVRNMALGVKDSEEIMAGILDSTNAISDDISQLSATSEEVAASSMEGLRTSEATVQAMQSCRDMLEEILGLAKQLQ